MGVAILIAILGSPSSPAAALNGFESASWTIAAISFAGGIVGLPLLARPPRAREAASPAPAAAA
jgi:hypothetical protein